MTRRYGYSLPRHLRQDKYLKEKRRKVIQTGYVVLLPGFSWVGLSAGGHGCLLTLRPDGAQKGPLVTQQVAQHNRNGLNITLSNITNRLIQDFWSKWETCGLVGSGRAVNHVTHDKLMLSC